MSKVEVNQISSQCGSTLTIGQSGDTVQLASGATQSGFGRTGTVNWQTTKKTASFTAVSGEGYFVDTSSSAITVTLPASPSAGDIVAIKDYANTADTNDITIARNGSNIDGGTDDAIIKNEGGSVVLVYADATKGWLVVEAAQKSDLGFPEYLTATGGTVTTSGNFKIHTFTGPGTFTVCTVGNACGSNSVDYLVVAGGGGAGSASSNQAGKGTGGTGAGGFRASSSTFPTACMPGGPLVSGVSSIVVSAQGYPITVGGGGSGGGPAPGSADQNGSNGSNSVFSTITSAGGGASGGVKNPTGATENPGSNGGSGGGGSGAESGTAGSGGSGNTPPVSPAQGTNGGDGKIGPTRGSGGGGGAITAGQNAPNCRGGNGGAGAGFTAGTWGPGGECSSCVQYFAGGGGGAGTSTNHGTGGLGGGADGSGPKSGGATGNSGTTNTGGGAGGVFGDNSNIGGSGGSGIVVIRYRFQ